MASSSTLLVLVALLAVASVANAQVCSDLLSCTECITSDAVYGCAWCVTDGSCRTATDAATNCAGNFLNPTSAITSQTDYTGDARPARTDVVLRKGQSLTVRVNVVIPTRKNIDLYYLFDLSGSMGDDLTSLRNLGNSLAQTMSSLCSGGASTSDTCTSYMLGTHVDKGAIPFGTSSDYSFRPEGSFFNFQFTTSFSTFTTALNNAGLSNGWDYPESQLDAMLQAVLCSNWNTNARHILLLATDDIGHMEGDELRTSTASDTMPFRASTSCWVSSATSTNDWQTKALTPHLSYTYPSWHQIKAAMISKNVIPIIAVVSSTRTNNYWDDFLANLGFGGRGALATDSSNVLSVISAQYRKIAGTVISQLADNGMDKYVRSITPSSYGVTDALRNPGDTCPFDIVLRDDAQTLGLSITRNPIVLVFLGFSSASIYMTAATCNCPSSACTGKCFATGTNNCDCGKCNCKSGYSGTTCSCLSGPGACPGACSGRGTCVCGVCQCLPGFTGANCECLDSCPSYNGVQCNGQGTCVCGQCKCNATYTGSACQCPSNPAASTCPNNCSGNGVCNPPNVAEGQCTASCTCNVGFTKDDCSCSSICKDKNNQPLSCGTGCDDASLGFQCGTCECGTCKCAPGYDPATNCTCKIQSCPKDEKGVECGGVDKGSCSCGACTCKSGWQGAACNCTTASCPSNCNFNGDCVCGKCVCRGNFFGSDCACSSTDVCPVGLSGLTCSGRGTCLQQAGSCGVCRCDAGFAGPSCNCTSKGCPATVNGTCNGASMGTCSTDGCGVCTCAPNVVGANCYCNVTSHPCPSNCSGHGVCLYDDTRCGVCQCDPTYTGDDCSCPIAGCPIVNGLECNGVDAGTCETPANACSRCVCKSGYEKADCSCKVQNCTRSVNDLECGGNGVCDKCTGVCTCKSGWSGIDCSTPDFDPCGAYLNCTSCLRDAPNLWPTYNCTWCVDGNGPCRRSDAQALNCRSYLKYTVAGNATVFQCPSDGGGGLTEEQTIGISAGLGGGLAVALIGALIAYKVIGMLMDKREWEKFEKGRQASQWKSDNNPLFQSSVKETENPLYVGNK